MQKKFFLLFVLIAAVMGYSADSTGIVEIEESTETVVEETDTVAVAGKTPDSSFLDKAENGQSIETGTAASLDSPIASNDSTPVAPSKSAEIVIGETEETAESKKTVTAETAKVNLDVPENKAVSKKVSLLLPVIQKKRRTAIIGNVLFGTGLLIKYGMIVPQSRKLGIEDTEDQLALISPGLLSLGLKVAGTTMSCMRTSESVDSYLEYVGGEEPRNLSWFSFFSGFGFMIGSQMAGYLGVMTENDNITAAATGIDILQDVVWAFSNIYSIVYITKLGEKAAASRVSVVPGVSSMGAPGLALRITF